MKTVLITGSNRGLGLEFVKHYSENNYNVIACCRNTDDANDYGYLDHIYTNNMPKTRKILGEFYEIIKSYTDHERISMLEVYLSPEDILPYYDVGDFPFNFELLFYEKDPTADDVLNRITSTLDNVPEGKHVNWVVSIQYFVV